MAPMRSGKLLLEAFSCMREPDGLTVQQIVKFYARTYNLPVVRAAAHVHRAVRQALDMGFAEKRRNRIVLATMAPAPAVAETGDDYFEGNDAREAGDADDEDVEEAVSIDMEDVPDGVSSAPQPAPEDKAKKRRRRRKSRRRRGQQVRRRRF